MTGTAVERAQRQTASVTAVIIRTTIPVEKKTSASVAGPPRIAATTSVSAWSAVRTVSAQAMARGARRGR